VLKQLATAGEEKAEFHLIMGKAYLNRDEPALAIGELDRATVLNPQLPFLHFNLGLAYRRTGDYQRAEAEFRRDIEVEPDLPDNYQQLGVIYARSGNATEAEKFFREALKQDSKMASAYRELAKLYQEQGKLEPALKMIDKTMQLAPDYEGGHYLRGRILVRLGREKEARAEFAAAQKALDAMTPKRRKAMGEEQEAVPNPELTRQPNE